MTWTPKEEVETADEQSGKPDVATIKKAGGAVPQSASHPEHNEFLNKMHKGLIGC